MEIGSSLYECTVMHHRVFPVRHKFWYRVFMFRLDLDEIDHLAERHWLLSRNRWNVFSLYDRDHLQRGRDTIKGNIIDLLRSNGIDEEIGTIQLVTHLRMFGYVFNPVSFYYIFDRQQRPLCAVAEVGNTFGEMKPYVIRFMDDAGRTFRKVEQKLFYVSPFIDLDASMDFRLGIPDKRLHIRIDDVEKGKKILITTLAGRQKPLTSARLLWYAVRFPFVTLQVIFKIHWQALRLYRKRLPYHRKASNIHLQQGVYDVR